MLVICRAGARYCGGVTKNPTYNQVCSGRTAHTEAVHVVYDPKKISFVDLLTYATHARTLTPRMVRRVRGRAGRQAVAGWLAARTGGQAHRVRRVSLHGASKLERVEARRLPPRPHRATGRGQRGA